MGHILDGCGKRGEKREAASNQEKQTYLISISPFLLSNEPVFFPCIAIYSFFISLPPLFCLLSSLFPCAFFLLILSLPPHLSLHLVVPFLLHVLPTYFMFYPSNNSINFYIPFHIPSNMNFNTTSPNNIFNNDASQRLYPVYII